MEDSGDQHGNPSRASRKIEAIVAAAEAAAEELRVFSEQRAAERIAEADRAADGRVSAAEAEAGDLLAQAREQASQTHDAAGREAQGLLQKARNDAEEIRRAAEAEAAGLREEARAERERVRQETQAQRELVGQQAAEELRQAREAAERMLQHGEQLTENLRQMSRSLHLNAERLINDVAKTHRVFVEELEKARPAGAARREPSPREAELGVPEFVPESPQIPRPEADSRRPPGALGGSREVEDPARGRKPEAGGERRGRWRSR